MQEITSNATAKRLLHGLIRHGKVSRNRTSSIDAVLRNLPRDRKGEGRDALQLLLRHEIVAKKPSNGRCHFYLTPAGRRLAVAF